MPANPQKPPHAAVAPATPALHACDSKQFDAEQLFAGAREIVIRHEGERYRLRRTSKGKLILTK
jgi:hemin uptake protein HemP